MTDDELASLDPEKYFGLVAALVPGAQGFMVLDAYGQALWCDPRAASAQLHHALPQVPRPREPGAPGATVHALTPCWEGRLHVVHVDSQTGAPLATLVLALGEGEHEEEAARSGLSLLARVLHDEHTLSGELQAMADELAARYEELNLVYDTEDQIGEFDEQDRVLQQLVENCVDYLGVDFAALMVPGKRIRLHHAHQRVAPPRLALMLDELDFGPLHAALDDSHCVVVNNPGDAQRHGLQRCLDKLIAAPVLIGREVDGALVCINGLGKTDFTNSDRSILDVLAKKASKVIQTNYDALSGLMKRTGLEHHIGRALADARLSGRHYAVLDADIDRLQLVNDADHAAGDQLIARVAGVVRASLAERDVVASLGGGRFGALLEGCTLEQAGGVAERLLGAVNELSFEWGEQRFEVSLSVGVTPLTAATTSIDELFTEVEMATRAAKENGRNRVQLFAPGDGSLSQRKREMGWVGRINKALRDDRLVLFAQPIVALQHDGPVAHREILVRMQDSDGGLVAPGAFLPAAERYQLMSAIDRWVVRHTLETLAGHGGAAPGTTWAINLSGQSLGDDGFLGYVTEELARTGIDASTLCFEVTETAAVDSLAAARRFIASLRELGGRFSLDDFGTGFSSFAYLKMLEVDYLKIDGSFVKDMATDAVNRAMVAAIHEVGRIVGTQTIAEFVEDDVTCEQLRTLGVDFGQGYGLGRPRPLLEELRVPGATALPALAGTSAGGS